MIIAKYTCNASGILPSFNTGYTNYTTNEINNADGTYTTEIAIDDVNNLPIKISFSDKRQLLSVEILNISKVTDMYNMFYNCSSLTELNIGEWNTVNVTNMSSMFFNCSSLTELNISKWNTSKVTSMNNTFYGCQSLTKLDLNNWDTSKVTNMGNTFLNCQSLTKLDLNNWDTSKVTNMNSMFYNCTKLTELNISKWNTSSVTNMGNMFFNCFNLTKLNMSKWNTSKVANMNNTFYSCRSLTKLDLNNWNTSSVTNMASMFYGCNRLTELNISKWNTSKVANTNNMFYGCQGLTKLNMSKWNTTSVTNMSNMFYSCRSLTELDLNNWDTSKVTNMASMFSDCQKLLSLDISNWSTDGTSDRTGMLTNCRVLRKVNLSNSSPATVSTIVSLLPNRSAVDNGYIFARVEVPNQNYWETILCKDSSVTVSLPQPLNKIGDVSDRLYWDEDKGHYCIEQNVREIVLNGSESWSYGSKLDNGLFFSNVSVPGIPKSTTSKGFTVLCDKFMYFPNEIHHRTRENIGGISGNIRLTISQSRLEKIDIDGMKKWLSENPTRVLYYLEEPNIIDLPHLNKKYSLDTYMPTTYLECSNSPIQPSRMYFETDKLKYKPLALETNKDYTIQFECSENSDTNVKVVLGGVEEEIEAVVGTNHINITTPEELSSDRLYISGQGNKVSDVMLIEGDMKQYPNYFDGVQSVGVLQDDNTYKIDIKTNEDFIVSIKTDLPLSKEDRLYWNDTNKRYEIDRDGVIEVPTVEGEVVNLPRLYQREDTVLTVECGNIKPSEIKIEYKNLN